jgi:hypothetical protein
MPDECPRRKCDPAAGLLETPADVHVVAGRAEALVESADRFERRPPECHVAARQVLGLGVGQQHLRDLLNAEQRLSSDIHERQNSYKDLLQRQEAHEIDAKWAELNQKPAFLRANARQKAQQGKFDNLRQVNGGAYPRNLSPVLYVIPLVLVGIAEWYVNFSTFAAIFIPAVAIAGTLIVAAIFAWASHLHGSYLKQLAEIRHPSVEYRNELGRKIALAIVSILLMIAFATIIWVRYVVIADQLGISSNTADGTFGGANASMVWSRLGPTIVLNILIWGLGTLYAWAVNEKVPELRESYRELLRANRKLDATRAPFFSEQKRIQAFHAREGQKNEVAVKEYQNLLEQIQSIRQRLEAN